MASLLSTCFVCFMCAVFFRRSAVNEVDAHALLARPAGCRGRDRRAKRVRRARGRISRPPRPRQHDGPASLFKKKSAPAGKFRRAAAARKKEEEEARKKKLRVRPPPLASLSERAGVVLRNLGREGLGLQLLDRAADVEPLRRSRPRGQGKKRQRQGGGNQVCAPVLGVPRPPGPLRCSHVE